MHLAHLGSGGQVKTLQDLLNRMAAGAGNPHAQQQLQAKAKAQVIGAIGEGVADLVQIMEGNGHNPRRAMITDLFKRAEGRH